MDAPCSCHCCTGRIETAQIDCADSHFRTWGVVPIEVSRPLVEVRTTLVMYYYNNILAGIATVIAIITMAAIIFIIIVIFKLLNFCFVRGPYVLFTVQR